VLSNTFLLIKDISKFLVLGLQQLNLSVHFVHQQGISRIDWRLLKALSGRYHGITPSLLSLLQYVNFTLRHSKFYGHSTRRLSALHHKHIVLELVMCCRESDIPQCYREFIDHRTELVGRGIANLLGAKEDGG
jgi:hypothetical protein